MKQIQPVNIWVNGEQKQGTQFSVTGNYDNYKSEATNQWQIFDADSNVLASSNLTIDGQDYIDWGNQPAMAINEWIYNWVADKLNLTII
jgi:hypothetical protein